MVTCSVLKHYLEHFIVLSIVVYLYIGNTNYFFQFHCSLILHGSMQNIALTLYNVHKVIKIYFSKILLYCKIGIKPHRFVSETMLKISNNFPDYSRTWKVKYAYLFTKAHSLRKQ